MNIQLNLSVSEENLHISIPQANHMVDIPNIIVLNPKTRRVYGIGDSQDDVKERLGENWEEAKNELKFLQAFTKDEADPELDKYIIFRFMTEAHKQVRQTSGLRLNFQRMIDRFLYNLTLPNFGAFSPERQRALVNFIQADLRAHSITINGKNVDIHLKLRRLDATGRLFFTLLLPYLLIAGGVFAALSLPDMNFFTTLLVVFIFGMLLELIGKSLWMLVMRRFLPAHYLRHFIPRLPLPGVTRRIANIILKD